MLKHYKFLVILHCFHRLLNSNCSSCFNCSSYFHIFPNKLVNRLTSNLMGAIHWGALWACFVDFMSFPELWSVKMFLQIIGKPPNRFNLCVMCKCEGWIHWNTPQVWLAFGYTLLIPSVSCPLVSWTVFAHLQTNSSLWNSSDLINSWSHSAEFTPFLCPLLVKRFLCICRHTADQIDMKFGGWTDELFFYQIATPIYDF